MTLHDAETLIRDCFPDLPEEVLAYSPDKLRLILKDRSFIDIRISQVIPDRFDFHWERRHVDNSIFRYDNFPDRKFKRIKTFPYHFHRRVEKKVEASPFSTNLPHALTDFLSFVRQKLKSL